MNDIRFDYGGEALYNKASMRLFEGEHTVLVGPNGSGKTTLLKLLNQELKPDSGTISWQNKKQIGYLDQYATLDGDQLVGHYLQAVYQPLFDMEKTMESLYEKVAEETPEKQEKLLMRASRLGEALVEADFYAIKSKVGSIMSGLGLPMTLLDEPIGRLSEGMRAKIILGKLLLEDADVLLLDEPTNFLDVRHIEWLTKFLNSYEKAFIVVSHHEGFLKDIARTVFALENGVVTRYKGDYAFYEKERELRSLQHEKAYKSQVKFIEKTEDFIQKNLTRAKTSKRAQSRRRMLKKIDKIAPPRKDRTYRFFFPLQKATGRDVLKIKDLEIGYVDSLVEPLSLVIRRQEKVVITGKNGIGKSTFLKTVLGEVEKINGDFEWIDTAKIAYFEQESNLPETMTPFKIVHARYPHFTRKDIMDLLANHGIDYAMANRRLDTLSGGETTKVRMALLRHQKGNVLILDEPTNHLDNEAKEALKEALDNYQGTVILVSHEAPFYESVCDYEIELFSTESS